MKIALISQNVSPGILIFRKDFIIHLLSIGYVVYAFALDYTEETERDVVALGAIPVTYKLNKAGLNPFLDIFHIYRLYRLLKKLSPDIVFSFFVKPSIYGTLAAKFAGVPRRIAMLEGLGYIYTQTEQGMIFKKRFLRFIHASLSGVSFNFADKVLFLNTDDVKDLSLSPFIDQSKLKVFGPIGLDLKNFPFSKPKLTLPIRFIFIARLSVEKGFLEYFAAARFVKKRFPFTEFLVLGGLDVDNPSALSKAELDEIIKDGAVTYLGYVDNVQEWIEKSHIFVMPSYREGFPRSTQEAMAIGRAVITTDVPGCRETVVEGLNGFLIPPWNAKILAEKMIYFIENPQEILRMGLQSHQIAVERFDADKINPVLAQVITGKVL